STHPGSANQGYRKTDASFGGGTRLLSKMALYLGGRFTLLGSFVIGCGECFSDRKEARNGLRRFKAVDSDCHSVFLLCFPGAKPLGSGESQCTRPSAADDVGGENRATVTASRYANPGIQRATGEHGRRGSQVRRWICFVGLGSERDQPPSAHCSG